MDKKLRQPEIDTVLNQCAEAFDRGGSKYPGMTYEQGVEAAIRWLIKGGENPMTD